MRIIGLLLCLASLWLVVIAADASSRIAIAEGQIKRDGVTITGFLVATTGGKGQLYPCGGGAPITVDINQVLPSDVRCPGNPLVPFSADFISVQKLKIELKQKP